MSHDERLNPADERTINLREEELIAEREMREVGEAVVRTVVEEEPAHLEVDAYVEEVEVEHVPVGQAVSERRPPWQDGDVLVVPVYEEQLVVTKRLLLREEIRVRRIATTRRERFEDSVRRERVVVDDPQHTGRVHERYPTGEPEAEASAAEPGSGVLETVRKALL